MDDSTTHVEEQDQELENSAIVAADNEVDDTSLDGDEEPEAIVCWYNGQGYPSGGRVCVRRDGYALGELLICYRPGRWVRSGACQ